MITLNKIYISRDGERYMATKVEVLKGGLKLYLMWPSQGKGFGHWVTRDGNWFLDGTTSMKDMVKLA